MTNCILSATAALLFSLPAVATAQDAGPWTGAYGGLTYSDGSGFQTYTPVNTYDLEGDGFGVIAGYNYATGPWVFGGEVAYSKTDIAELPTGDDYKFTSLLDLKVRAGYATGNVLFFGTIGGTMTQWQEGTGNDGHDGNGMLIGVGVDYLVSPRFFVGAEYVRRNVTSDWASGAFSGTFDADVDTISLRLGMKF